MGLSIECPKGNPQDQISKKPFFIGRQTTFLKNTLSYFIDFYYFVVSNID